MAAAKSPSKSPSKEIAKHIKTAKRRTVIKIVTRVIKSAVLQTKKIYGVVKLWSISENNKSQRFLFNKDHRNPKHHHQLIQELVQYKSVPFSTIIVNKSYIKIPDKCMHLYLNANAASFQFKNQILPADTDVEPDPVTSDDEFEG